MERALRPSSRQDNLGGSTDVHPPPQHKPALEKTAPASPGAQQPSDGEASVRIVPPAKGSSGGDSRLVLLLKGQQSSAGQAAAPAGGPTAGQAEAAAERGVSCLVLVAEAGSVHSRGAEDCEVMLEAQEVSPLPCCSHLFFRLGNSLLESRHSLVQRPACPVLVAEL